ncbi:uncharacterized protein LOC128854313 isoform X5 [Cuculus canorus]|nr:uncharacterized protein LOC128854313 isoform X5 [Cuculus canorus]
MGRQRAQPVPGWRQLLCAGCWWLLSLSGMVLQGLRWLWKLAWFLLICYKSCWDSAFQTTEELGTVLWLRLENSSEEDGDSNSALESRQAGGSPALRGCPQRRSWAGWVPRGFGKSRAVVSGQWQSNSGKVTPLRLCWKDWRHWRLTSASSAPSWALRSCCGAVGSWSCCRSSKACASGCRNARGAGTASTAPSCQGKRRMKVGARERALQDASGWSLPSSQPRAQAAAWGQRLRECQRNGEQEPAGKQLWRSLCLLCCPGQVTASPCPGPPPVLTVP